MNGVWERMQAPKTSKWQGTAGQGWLKPGSQAETSKCRPFKQQIPGAGAVWCFGDRKAPKWGLLGMRGWALFSYLLAALLDPIESVCPLTVVSSITVKVPSF